MRPPTSRAWRRARRQAEAGLPAARDFRSRKAVTRPYDASHGWRISRGLSRRHGSGITGTGAACHGGPDSRRHPIAGRGTRRTCSCRSIACVAASSPRTHAATGRNANPAATTAASQSPRQPSTPAEPSAANANHPRGLTASATAAGGRRLPGADDVPAAVPQACLAASAWRSRPRAASRPDRPEGAALYPPWRP